MTAIRESIEIDRRPEEVYAYASDPVHLPEWQENAIEAHRVGDAPLGLGSRVEVTRHIGRRVMPMTMEITEYDPPRTWRIQSVGGPVRGDVHGTVEPLDDGRRARLTIDVDFEGHGMGKVLVPMVVRPQVRKELPRNERHLKDVLEREG